MMDDSEDNLGDDQEFRGFETPENYMSEDSVQENSKEESHKEEEKNQEKTVDSSLPNGTDVIKDDKMEEDEDCDDEDDEEAEKKSEGGGGSAGDEGAPEKTNEMSVENEMSPEEMSNKEEEDEPKTEPTRKRLRSASKEESDEIAGCRSSDEEDFLGFDTPDTSKEEFLKALLVGLNDELSVNHFTFFKGPIGIGDPNKEIIREAKVKPPIKGSEDGMTTPAKRLLPKPKGTPSAILKTTPKSVQPAEQSSKTSLTPRVVIRGGSVPKNKSSLPMKSKLGFKDKKRKSAGPDDVDNEDWSPEPKAKTNGVKRGSSSPVEGASPPPEKKQRTKENSSTGESPGSHPVIQNFMMNLNAGYIALLHAFQYLKVHELLRASCVSHMWRHIASHTTLWETVRMKNSRVRDWEGFGRALSTSGTRFLDLKKMLLPDDPEEIEEMWLGLSKAVTKVKSLKKVDLGRCTPDAVESVALSCPQLESLTSLTIRGLELDMTPISLCSNLTELKLKSVGGIDIKNLHFLAALKELKHLSLTTVKSLNGIETVLSTKLESLELGECSALNESVATVILPKLTNLKRLRLEKGQGPNCPIMPLLNTIATLPNLTLLELINFDVKPGFDKALAKCTNLRTLLIIPTYVTQSATTNHVVMGGVSKLSSTLTYFVWGLTLELLRVTDLFIDQVEGQKTGKPQAPGSKKGSGDSIPILKPLVEDSTSESSNKEGSGGGSGGHTASQVDILALPKLQKVLSTLLPTTKIKILKVPFSATWRQTVSDVPQ